MNRMRLVEAFRRHTFGWILLVTGTCVVSAGCTQPEDRPMRRGQAIQREKDRVVVGLVYDHGRGASFGAGAVIAVEQFGKDLLGRTVEVRELDDRGEVVSARRQAQSLVDDLRVLAVLGHDVLRTARGAALQYEFNGVDFLTPASGPAPLSREGFRFCFRLRPASEAFGRFAAELVAKKGLRSVAFLSGSDEDALATATAFDRTSDDLHLRVRKGFPLEARKDVASVAADAAGSEPSAQAWVLAASGVELQSALDELARTGWSGPVVVFSEPPGKVPPSLLPQVLIVRPTPMVPADDEAAFRRTWSSRYRSQPDDWAVAGFDGGWALIEAIRRANELTPTGVSRALHAMGSVRYGTGKEEPWFDERGGRAPSALHAQRWESERWVDD